MTRRIALLLAATLVLNGCATSRLSFRQDNRIRIVAPSNNARVPLPLRIRWTVENYEGYFAVFVDGSPMRPGRGLLSLVPRLDPCRSRNGCPDASWLGDHHTYVTRSTSLVVDRLPDRRGRKRGSDRHTLTIVLLDEDGTRNGEAAFVREFIVERDS